MDVTIAGQNPDQDELFRRARLATIQTPPPPVMAAPDMAPKSDLSIFPSKAQQIKAPRGTVEGDQARYTDIASRPAALEQVHSRIENSDFGQAHPTAGKILGWGAQIPASIADIGLSALMPRLGAVIPGTSLNRGLKLGNLEETIGKEQTGRREEAQAQNQEAEAGLHAAQTEGARLITISPEEAQSLGDPALEGQQLTQGAFQHLITNARTVQGRKDVAETNADARRDVAQMQADLRQKLATLKPEQRDDRAIRLMEKDPASLTQEEQAYLGAYHKWVNETKVQPGIARAQAFANFRPVQVLGPNGEVQYQYAGNAIKSGAATPGSMDFRTALNVAKAFTSGPQAAQLTAFRTASDHLELLKEAAAALQNGDNQTLNKLSNAFKTEFGKPAPTNFDALAEMLSGEIATSVSKGTATVSEMDQIRKQLSERQSNDQIAGIIETNQNAINEKANELLQQYTEGMQGRPVFAPLSAGGGRPTEQPKGPQGGTGGTVKMKAPNGETSDVPRDQVEHFKKLGAVEVK